MSNEAEIRAAPPLAMAAVEWTAKFFFEAVERLLIAGGLTYVAHQLPVGSREALLVGGLAVTASGLLGVWLFLKIQDTGAMLLNRLQPLRGWSKFAAIMVIGVVSALMSVGAAQGVAEAIDVFAKTHP